MHVVPSSHRVPALLLLVIILVGGLVLAQVGCPSFVVDREETRYTYDDEGRRTSTIDALGNTSRWSYDASGQLPSLKRPLGEVYRQRFLFCVTPNGPKYPPYRTCSGIELPFYCVDDDVDHLFSVTLPGGQTELFQLKLDTIGSEQQCLEINVPDAVHPYFSPRPGTTSALEALDSEVMWFRNILHEDGSSEWQIAASDFEPWSPTRYRLTTPDGIVYIIHATNGLESITDLEGNKVSYLRDRIAHSSGLHIALTRDSQGRITRATDPDLGHIDYSYDARGDLTAVTDRTGQTVRYTTTITT